MPMTFSNATLQTNARDAEAAAFNTLVNTGSGTAVLRLRNSTTTLVDINLPNPAFTTGVTPGVATLLGVPLTGVASAGTATVPDNYQLLNRNGTLVASGTVTGADGITTGQTVTVSSFSHTVQA